MRPSWLPACLLLCACQPGAFDALSEGRGREPDAGPDPVVRDDAGADAAEPEPDPGCEDSGSVEHCGRCGRRCLASTHAVAACVAQRCIERRVRLESPTVGPLYGDATTGGDYPSPQLCGADEVLLGLSGVGDTIAYGMAVHCGRIALIRTEAGDAVEVVATRQADPIGGNIAPPPPPFELRCPDGAVVTAVAGATWLFPDSTARSIRQISLSCAQVVLDAAGALSLAPLPDTLTVGDTAAASAVTFSEPCAGGAVVTGFTGRSGAYIDGLAVHCATPAVESAPGDSVDVPAG